MSNFSDPKMPESSNEEGSILLDVYLVESGEEIQRNLSIPLKRAGFNLVSFSHHSELEDKIKQTRPIAVLLEMRGDDEQNVLSNLDCHAKLSELNIPTTLLADHDDMASRLRASRAGVEHYLVHPVETEQLLEALSNHVNSKDEEPYRVLIVDDDELLLKLFEVTLKRSGFEVKTLTDSLNVLDVIDEFQPELIFMDVQMPQCSGPEAAAVIRQIPELDVIPIIFLSGDTVLELQLAALTQGGDDFLTKPVDSTHLVVTATARAARARGLQQTQQRLRQTAEELKRYQQNAEHEQNMAQA